MTAPPPAGDPTPRSFSRYNQGMSIELQYAPTRRRRIRWRWVFLVLLLITAVPLWHYRKELVAHAKLRWTLGQCRTYTRPADSIALEANTYHASQLGARDSSYTLLPKGGWPISVRLASTTLTSSYTWHEGEAYKSVPRWDALAALMIPPGRQTAYLRSMGVRVPTVPLFVHERACKDRPARLVVVQLGVEGLEGIVIAPGHPWQKPTLIWRGPTHNLGETIPDTLGRVHHLSTQLPAGQAPPSLSLRQLYGPDALQPPGHIYFGQPDPSDAAKFTIRVEIGKTPFDFVGQLLPDDTIQIDGPLLSEIFEKLGGESRR